MLDNHPNRNKQTIRNSWQHNEAISKTLRDQLTSNQGVIAAILTEFHPGDLTIQGSHHSSDEENEALAAIHG